MPTLTPTPRRRAAPSLIVALFAAALFAACAAPNARAQSVLYYSDGALNPSGNILPQVLSGLGITPTNAADEADFVTKVNQGGWDLVILSPQLSARPDAETALINWVGGGGKAIAGDVSGNAALAGAFGAQYTGQESVTLGSNGSTFWSGVSSPITLANPGFDSFGNPGGYASYSADMTVRAGGTAAGTFTETGDASIVIGNNGRTVLNGFLDDTYDDQSKARRLALENNEVQYVLGGVFAVPESGTAFLMTAGIFLPLLSLFIRRQSPRMSEP